MSAHTELIRFVLDAAEREPASRRARLYGALAVYELLAASKGTIA